jgi:predicted transcriptional regulator
MTLRVSPGFKQMLDQAAKREQRSRTNFLEKLVGDYCRSVGVESEKERPDPEPGRKSRKKGT